MPALVLPIVVLALLASAAPGAAVELAGTAWASGQHRVSFDGRQATVTGGCNILFASYRSDGGAISFGTVNATRRACPPDRMAADRFAAAALRATRRVARTRDRLHLLDARGRAVWTLARAG